MASTGSGDSLFSLPSTAHFGQQSPALDPAIVAEGIAAAPAPSGPPDPTAQGPSDPSSGITREVATGEPQLINYNYLLLSSTSNSPSTRSAPATSSYQPSRGCPRTYSSPRGGGIAAARARSGPNMDPLTPDPAQIHVSNKGDPVVASRACPSSGGGATSFSS